MQCTTVLYPNKPGAHFDFDYYVNKHIPMALKLVGNGIARTEVRKGLAAPDGSPPAFLCLACIWIGDSAEYQAKFAQHGSKIMADVANFTNVAPIVQTDESLI